MGTIASTFFKDLAEKIPNLEFKLRQADIAIVPEKFLKKVFTNTIVFSVFASGYVFFLGREKLSPLIILALMPIFLVIFFLYFLRLPDVRIAKKKKAIDREIVFAIRFLIIELQSGISIYKAFLNITKNYKNIGFYTRVILDKISLGTSIEEAIKDTIDTIPSNSLQRVFYQILNSMETGSDMGGSIRSTLDQIIQEQYIQVKEYGRKLNPVAMFYMLVAIVFPSLGMTLLVVISLFLGFTLTLTMLLIFAFAMAFVQMLFLSVIKSQRPAVGL